MTAIKTVLFSRFSVRKPHWNPPYRSEESRIGWMRWRADLLEDGLASCLRCQTFPVTAAYLLMAEGDEEFFRKYVDGDLFRPLFLELGGSENAQVTKALKGDSLDRDVLLTRVDTDDLIARTYLERFATAAAGESGPQSSWLTASDGGRSDLAKIQRVHYPNSPFYARYLRKFDGEPLFVQHTTVPRYSPRLVSGTSWWQLIHGTNVSNAFWEPTPQEDRRDDRRYAETMRDFDEAEFRGLFGFSSDRLRHVLSRGYA